MSTSTEVIFVILFAIGYLLSPTILIWGWVRWLGQPKQCTAPSILSLIGFVFASTSALLAVSSIAYALIHGFTYYDPLLLRIFRWGLLLPSVGPYLASVVCGDETHSAGTRLFLLLGCLRSGYWLQKVNNFLGRALLLP